jgi:TRAP-type C4-dicarboxylate transport system permease small subunit
MTMRVTRGLRAVDAALDRATRWGAMLVLPLALLLCAQWPLRDGIGAGSRQANDLAQWIFALYVAFALRHATRVRGHLATEAFAARYPPARRRAIGRWGTALCVLPWSLFLLATSSRPAWQSLRGLEAFPDTLNPGYFIIKCSVWLLAALAAWQAAADLLAPRADGEREWAGPAS